MKSASFQLHAPTTVEEAAELLHEHGDDAKPLAGGQSLVPLMALRLARYEHLIDLNRVDGMNSLSRRDGWLTVGAMARQAEAEASVEVAEALPLLHQALPLIGHFQVRNRGTVGGSITHADPASELPAVTLALDAEMVVADSGGVRSIPARDFFVATWTTALASDELLTAVRYPIWRGRCGFAIEEFARRRGDFAIAGVACAVETGSEGTVARAAISFFGMAATPVRAGEAEGALTGTLATETEIREVAHMAAAGTDPMDDIHGSAAFRRRVGAHLTERALRRALEEAAHA
jgi:aerobic carbon-monoxide dehydrogenase medium subunit